jgi:hypothetical protein
VAPACPQSCFDNKSVALPILAELGRPEFSTHLRQFEDAAFVAMPEAAVHMNGDLVFRQHDVRMAGHRRPVEAKSISELV